jgi:diaminohydroxyphosphoribosylaminopyrimidine deaminase/5-amino-6-(5-phosphoribosylamino)uracil reductase
VLARTTPIPADAKVHPCTVWNESLPDLLDVLGQQGVIQLMVEAGPTLATAFHTDGLVHQYVFHIAPTLSGSLDAPGVFVGNTQLSLDECTIVSTTALGDDFELILEPLTQKVGAL